ncbi:DUF3311 domain-containing protein [Halopenitus sp. H-Gu1]|uniref:DUF3311 domain-containing protein n=1 Tax=Halopenitus sp. H-Gu1 TaxID=3242697 RepID=UPI00359DF1F0
MVSRDLLWIPVFALLVAFAVPWFMWGMDTIVAGLPIWLWWHIGWMILSAACFYWFASGAWDRAMGIDPEEDAGVIERREGASTESEGEPR